MCNLKILKNGMLFLDSGTGYRWRLNPTNIVTVSPNKKGEGYFITTEHDRHYFVDLPYEEITRKLDRALDIFLTNQEI